MSTKIVSVPKYRRHKGAGQAFVQVNGRRHYLGKWDSPRSKDRCMAHDITCNLPVDDFY